MRVKGGHGNDSKWKIISWKTDKIFCWTLASIAWHIPQFVQLLKVTQQNGSLSTLIYQLQGRDGQLVAECDSRGVTQVKGVRRILWAPKIQYWEYFCSLQMNPLTDHSRWLSSLIPDKNTSFYASILCLWLQKYHLQNNISEMKNKSLKST